MKVVIEGTPTEIAALALAAQERRISNINIEKTLKCNGDELSDFNAVDLVDVVSLPRDS